MVGIKYHILFVSFILSALLWLSLNMDQSYEVRRTVPVKINVEKPYAVSNIIPLNLDVKIKAKGWSLLRLYTSLNPEFNYDINNFKNENYIIPVMQSLNENSGFGPGFSVTYVKPETLDVHLGKYEEKYVKILPYVEVKCRDGYQIVGNPVLDPDSIKIGGASALLGKIQFVYTKLTRYDGVNANISDVVKVSDSLSNIISFSREDVNLTIKIELTADKEFKNVEMKVSNTPSDRDVLLIPQNIDVQLKGGVKQLSELDNGKIFANIDYNTIFNDTTGSVSPYFTLPEGLKVISFKPEKIQYVIKKKF